MPGPPAYNSPQGPGSSSSQSRQRVVEGAVFLESDLKEIPLPSLDGFSVVLELGSPASSTPTPSANAKGSKSAGARTSPGATAQSQGRAARGADTLIEAAQAATVSPASPSPAASASSPPAAPAGKSAPPASSPAPKATPKGPKITTKTTVYPDAAPAAPSPQPTGDVQTYGVRTAIVRGYLLSAVALNLYGLGAVRFTIPAEEEKDGRGFTIAVFEEGHHHHTSLLAFDAGAKESGGVVSASGTKPLALKKNTGYVLMLYGDQLAPDTGSRRRLSHPRQ